MRAKELLNEQDKNINITVPITITIPAGGGDPSVSTAAADDAPEQPVMVPPLQQHIELAKKDAGKNSDVIDQIVSDNGANSDTASHETLVSDQETQEIGAVSAQEAQKNLALRNKFEELQAKLAKALSELSSPPVRSS